MPHGFAERPSCRHAFSRTHQRCQGILIGHTPHGAGTLLHVGPAFCICLAAGLAAPVWAASAQSWYFGDELLHAPEASCPHGCKYCCPALSKHFTPRVPGWRCGCRDPAENYAAQAKHGQGTILRQGLWPLSAPEARRPIQPSWSGSTRAGVPPITAASQGALARAPCLTAPVFSRITDVPAIICRMEPNASLRQLCGRMPFGFGTAPYRSFQISLLAANYFLR